MSSNNQLCFQGKCFGCYSFGGLGALEGQLKRVTGKLIPLSEQNILDCSWRYNRGCDGGFINGVCVSPNLQAFTIIIIKDKWFPLRPLFQQDSRKATELSKRKILHMHELK